MLEFKEICKNTKQYNKENNTNLTYVEYFFLYKSDKDSLSDLPDLIALDLKNVLKNINFEKYPFIDHTTLLQSDRFEILPLFIEGKNVNCLIREDEVFPLFYDLHNKNKKCGHLKFYSSFGEYFVFEDKYNFGNLTKHAHKYLKDHNKIFIKNKNLSTLINLSFNSKRENLDNYINFEEVLKSSNKIKNFYTDLFNECYDEMNSYLFNNLFNINIDSFDYNKIKRKLKTSDIHICKNDINHINIYQDFMFDIFTNSFSMSTHSQKNDNESILFSLDFSAYGNKDLILPKTTVLLHKKTAYLSIGEDYKEEHDSDDVFMNLYDSVRSIHEYINRTLPETNKVVNNIIKNTLKLYGINSHEEFVVTHNIKKSQDLYKGIPFSILFSDNSSQYFEMEVFEMISAHPSIFSSKNIVNQNKTEIIENNILKIKALSEKYLLNKNIIYSQTNDTKKRL